MKLELMKIRRSVFLNFGLGVSDPKRYVGLRKFGHGPWLMDRTGPAKFRNLGPDQEKLKNWSHTRAEAKFHVSDRTGPTKFWKSSTDSDKAVRGSLMTTIRLHQCCCRGWNVLVSTLRFCWRFWSSLMVTKIPYLFTQANIQKMSPTSLFSHQHRVLNTHKSSSTLNHQYHCRHIIGVKTSPILTIFLKLYPGVS